MNIYILCPTANTQSKEYICSAHPEGGMDVAQRPHLYLSSMGSKHHIAV